MDLQQRFEHRRAWRMALFVDYYKEYLNDGLNDLQSRYAIADVWGEEVSKTDRQWFEGHFEVTQVDSGVRLSTGDIHSVLVAAGYPRSK